MPETGVVAAANAGVAGLGLLGNVLLARTLDRSGFAAVSLYLVAFQFLQDAMGRSLNWAMLRLAPAVEAERAGGADAVILATRSVQRRFAAAGVVLVAAAAVALSPWLDAGDGPSRVLMLVLAGVAAAFAVDFHFGLGVLQLREQFRAYGGWLAGSSGLRVVVWGALWAAGILDLATALAGHVASTLVIMLALGRANGPLVAGAGAGGRPLSAADRRRVVRFGGSMVLATALAAFAAQIDLFLLDVRTDDATTTRLRVAALMAGVIELATNAVMIALLPRAGRAHDAAAQRRHLRTGFVLGGLITAGAALSLPVVEYGLPVLFGERYADATGLYPILLGGVVLTALTDPLALVFLSRDRPGRFVLLNGTLLLVVVAGNLLVPGGDRALVAAWVRTAGRACLALGIVWFLVRDSRHPRAPECGPGPAPAPDPVSP